MEYINQDDKYANGQSAQKGILDKAFKAVSQVSTQLKKQDSKNEKANLTKSGSQNLPDLNYHEELMKKIKITDYGEFQPLLPSLQEYLGMVSNPNPKRRAFPSDQVLKLLPSTTYSDEGALGQEEIANLICAGCVPKPARGQPVTDNYRRIQHNIAACLASVSLETLKQYVKKKKRIDVEQTVALVIALLAPPHKRRLVLQSEVIFRSSYMWLEVQDKNQDFHTEEEQQLLRKVKKIQWNLQPAQQAMGPFREFSEERGKLLLKNQTQFFEKMKLIRRRRAVVGELQTLRLPEATMKDFGVAVGGPFKRSYSHKNPPLHKISQDLKGRSPEAQAATIHSYLHTQTQDMQHLLGEGQRTTGSARGQQPQKVAPYQGPSKGVGSERGAAPVGSGSGVLESAKQGKCEETSSLPAGSSGQEQRLGADSQSSELTYISKRRFKRINKYLGRMDGKQDVDSIYGRQIRALLNAFYNKDQIALMDTQDTLSFAFSFTNFMRRLQPKIVSNVSGSSMGLFMKKDESKTIQQNTPQVLTSFEVELAHLAQKRAPEEIDELALTCIKIPPGLEISKEQNEQRLLLLVDWCCLLMERYVKIYGGGNFDNLVFKKEDKGGKGRGSIDRYNLLIDILRDIRQKCYDQNIVVEIKPCHKFLAKDIMHFNEAWLDDAFANKKRPGWVFWLNSRRRGGRLTLEMEDRLLSQQ